MEIISFFSFKGGVGRTALMMSIAAHWAMQGKRVAVVDFDISAPGLSLLPCMGEWLNPVWRGRGVGDALDPFYRTVDDDGPLDFVPPTSLFRFVTPPEGRVWGDGGAMYAISAGTTQIAAVEGRESVDTIPREVPRRGSSARERHFQLGLRDLGDGWREDLADFRDEDGRGLDYVLIDCRTGFPELIDLSLGYLADRMVVLSGLNEQNQRGLRLVLKALTDTDGAKPAPVGQLAATISVVLTPVPTEPAAEVEIAIAMADSLLQDICREGEPPPRCFTLPYWPRLAFADPPFYDMGYDQLPPYLGAMETIADALAGRETTAAPVDAEAASRRYRQEGERLYQRGELGGAETAFANSARAARIARNDRGRAWALMGLGDVLQGRRDWEWTARGHQQALRRLEALAKAAPDDERAQRDWSSALNRLGDVLLLRGDVAKALAAYRQSLAIRERLAAKATPDDRQAQTDLAVSCRHMGLAHQELEQWPEALTQLEKARDLLVTLEASADHDVQRPLAVCEQGIGDVLARQENWPAAQDAYGRSLKIFRQLAADNAHHELQYDLLLSLIRYGDALRNKDRRDEARVHYLEGLAIGERLVTNDPSNAQWQSDLIVTLERLSAPGMGDKATRIARLTRAIELHEKLAKGNRLRAVDAGLLDGLRQRLAALRAEPDD